MLAEWLHAHDKVERAIYPGLSSHPQYHVAQKQMHGQGGAMISIIVKNGVEGAKRMLSRTKLFTLAESLGFVASLIEHPALMTHAMLDDATRAKLGIADGLIRLSVGIEHIDDLRDDLAHALG